VAGELRVTGGRLARRRFKVPAAADRGTLRPTSDRVREAIFSSLRTFMGPLDELRVLDLYAGSGALGIEALSRGAAAATFVERDRRVARTLRENLRSLDLEETAELVCSDVDRWLGQGATSFDLVFADPPYRLAIDEGRAAALAEAVAEGGLLVLERDTRSEDEPPPGLSLEREGVYGSTRVTLWRR
jgi:16S rRNA (guanine966-N2)-methyltransferase